MATNRTLQQKRRAGCLKGGASTAREPLLAPESPRYALAPDSSRYALAPESPRYALALVSDLKIRLMRRDTQSSTAAAAADAAGGDGGIAEGPAEASALAPSSSAATAASMALESDGEELLEEDGDDDGDDASEGDAATTAAVAPPVPAARTCLIDVPAAGRPLVATVCGEGLADGVRRLAPVATVPLDACGDPRPPPLATLRGLALAELVDGLHERRVALVAEAAAGEGDADSPSRRTRLLLLPASRLPWPSLAVHRPAPAPQEPAPAQPESAPLPDWWREWDGPPSAVNLNSLRRSDAFMQQFSD